MIRKTDVSQFIIAKLKNYIMIIIYSMKIIKAETSASV